MSVYARYKKDPDGLRALVELLEATTKEKREKMVNVGMMEDPVYTEQALRYLFTFDDICNLPDMELAEVITLAPPNVTAFAIHQASDEIKAKFAKNTIHKVAIQIRELKDANPSLSEIGRAKLKLISVTRSLEKVGKVRTKKIPRL